MPILRIDEAAAKLVCAGMPEGVPPHIKDILIHNVWLGFIRADAALRVAKDIVERNQKCGNSSL